VLVTCQAGKTPNNSAAASVAATGEGQHQRVERETHVETRVGGGHHSHQRAVKKIGSGEAGYAADSGERQTFGDELADEAAAARPEREP